MNDARKYVNTFHLTMRAYRFQAVHNVVPRTTPIAPISANTSRNIPQGRDTRSLQDYLGHRNIQSTVRYTELKANRFNGGCWDPPPHPPAKGTVVPYGARWQRCVKCPFNCVCGHPYFFKMRL